jgi:glycosyltransferase involved in cell wall biosynthesis
MTVADGRVVAHVVPYYPPHLGGMEAVVQTLAEALATSRRVVVLTSRAGAATEPSNEQRSNLEVRRLLTLEVAHLPFTPTLLIHLLRLPRDAVVHVHVAQAYVPEMVWLAGALRRRPFVAHFHLDVEPSGPFGPLFNVYKRHLLGRTLRAAALVIVLSADQATFVQSQYGVPADRTGVVPNAVGTEFYVARDSQAARDPIRLLYVGRLEPQKNVGRLLRAMAEVRAPAHLTVVGDGSERSALEALVAELILDNVDIVGAQRGEDLLAWYRWADAFVLPSDKEGMPLVILEAMAAGLPVIATDVAGVRDTVGDDGLLAAPNPSALALAIDRVAADEDLRRELARRSRDRSAVFSWPVVVRRLEDLYQAVER